MLDQPGIAGKDAVFLGSKGLTLQTGEDFILPGSMGAVIEDRCLFADLLEQRRAKVGEELRQRHDMFIILGLFILSRR